VVIVDDHQAFKQAEDDFIIMILLREDKQLYDIVIWIKNVQLRDAISTRSRAAYDLDSVRAQVLLSSFKIGDLKSDMSGMTTREFIGLKATGLQLRGTPRLVFSDNMNFGIARPKPGTREIEIAGSWNFLYTKHLAIKIARAIHIFDKQCSVTEAANFYGQGRSPLYTSGMRRSFRL
jgi:hypothetical protein